MSLIGFLFGLNQWIWSEIVDAMVTGFVVACFGCLKNDLGFRETNDWV